MCRCSQTLHLTVFAASNNHSWEQFTIDTTHTPHTHIPPPSVSPFSPLLPPSRLPQERSLGSDVATLWRGVHHQFALSGREQSSTHACRRRGARTFFRHCHLKTSGLHQSCEHGWQECHPSKTHPGNRVRHSIMSAHQSSTMKNCCLNSPFCLQHVCTCTDHQLDHGHVFAWLYDASKRLYRNVIVMESRHMVTELLI